MAPDLIYDVGMNDGGDTNHYLSLGYRVVAIEADPTLAKHVTQRFQSAVDDGRLTILNAAIADREGVLPFWICEARPEWNSFDRSIASRNGQPHHAIEVQCITFDKVLRTHGTPRYLKIDIEGYDHLCLEALADCGRDELPQYISFEKGTEAVARLPLLRDLGYDGFKLINQWLFLPVQAEPLPDEAEAAAARRIQRFMRSRTIASKAVARLGGRKLMQQRVNPFRQYGAIVFPMGTSGPIGENTRGEWLSFTQVMEQLAAVDQAIELGRDYRFWDPQALNWIDIHARLAE